MSIIQAMFAGSSALTNFGEAMTVIGNNLANANTTAFKASSASFEDVLIQTVGDSGAGAATQIGTGVGLADVQQDMSQGSFASTSNVTDLSIDGRGFFMVKDNTIGEDNLVDESGRPLDTFFTRAGGFKKNVDGDLVTSGGMVLQGWELDIDGEQEAGGLVDINLGNFVNTDPLPTSLVKVGANLDSTTEAKDLSIAYKADDPATYDFSTSVRTFDSRGQGHNVEIQFRKLPMAIPATVTGGNPKDEINFNLGVEGEEATDVPVTFTFTPIQGVTETTPIITATVTRALGSHHTVSLSELAGESMVKDVRYKIEYETTADTGTRGTTSYDSSLKNLVGSDSQPEILGVDNDNSWDWHAVVKTSELEQDHRGVDTLTAVDESSGMVTAVPGGATYKTGRLVFDNLGKLQSEGSTPLKFHFTGAEEQEILFDFGDAKGANADATNDFSKKTLDLVYEKGLLTADVGNTGGDGSLQVASGFATLQLEQNGFPSGFLDKLAVTSKGEVIGNYTNGQSKKLYQVAVVDFDDESALEQTGSNLFVETVSSGLPRVGAPLSGRLGSIVSFSLEQANVDMSAEFVRMITTQRGFQANSRIVTVTDGMLEELLALKR